ncbi:hypothetical protein PENANT_c027G08388 [Penicillium antarcticum]|uniref:Uncharacterized protein n=1 Tax=Penicillium antarcticum TaxID=416450 RepID=A0A1V6PXJ8_9EURO|nr:hypothetical protein PENANT_c027G08388 [Penicillium antarcticum]
MKPFLTTITCLATLAAAENCQNTLNYCSFTLMGKGDYHQQILAALRLSSPPIDPSLVNYDYYLYRCDDKGEIHKTQNCPYGCQDGGSNESDRCI